ncbi:hypothetical protein HG530_013785 [Fusarium avenaceum]|nr:hypothetical protein HG530_013785 [Fusarium avenaceum]
MVNFVASIALLLTAASSVVAVPNTIEARKVSCMDNLPADSLANVKEAVECINYLASLGNQPCVAKVSGQSFCRRGNTQITGLARNGPSATSTCQDVARGAGFIMDKCSRGDGKVRGQNEAWANGNLLVDIRNNPLLWQRFLRLSTHNPALRPAWLMEGFNGTLKRTEFDPRLVNYCLPKFLNRLSPRITKASSTEYLLVLQAAYWAANMAVMGLAESIPNEGKEHYTLVDTAAPMAATPGNTKDIKDEQLRGATEN